MKNSYSIALTGPVGSGRTTFLAELCSLPLKGYLWDQIRNGVSPNTVIPCYYSFTENGWTRISEIVVYKSCITAEDGSIHDGLLPEGITTLINCAVDYTVNRESICDGQVLVHIPVDRWIWELSKLMHEEYRGIIHHVKIDAQGNSSLRHVLKHRGVQELVIQDLRGFGMEQPEAIGALQQGIISNKNFYGYTEADGVIVFAGAGCDGTVDQAHIYTNTLRDFVNSKQVLVLFLSKELTEAMRKEDYMDLVAEGGLRKPDRLTESMLEDIKDIADVESWPIAALAVDERLLSYHDSVFGSFGSLLRRLTTPSK